MKPDATTPYPAAEISIMLILFIEQNIAQENILVKKILKNTDNWCKLYIYVYFNVFIGVLFAAM